MEHNYIKLVHSNPTHEEWFVVNWCMGNTCNFECSYCPENLHSGDIKWPELDKDLQRIYVLRRVLNPMNTMDSMEFILERIRDTKTNAAFLDKLNS